MIPTLRAVFLAVLAASATPVDAKPTVEVVHFWTSGGEANAMKVVRDAFEKAGGRWIDTPIAGGGGDNASKILQARLLAGNPPDAATHGGHAREWADAGALADLEDLARAEHWDEHLPEQLRSTLKYKGKYLGVPITIERMGVLYANTAVLRRAGVTVTPGWPKNWEQFNAAAEKIRKMGLIPLAHGGQPWQDSMLFNIATVGVGGPQFYKKAIVELDQDQLSSPTMEKVFDQMRRLKGFTDAGSPGRNWNLTTAMVIKGEAAFQLLGSFAKGEFLAAGKKPGEDFLCLPVPGGGQSFLGGAGASFIFFKNKDPERISGQKLLAHLLMTPEVQIGFNRQKGGVPPLTGISHAGLDPCARLIMEDYAEAARRGLLLAGPGNNDPAATGVVTDAVTNYFNSDMSSQEAVKQLTLALNNSK